MFSNCNHVWFFLHPSGFVGRFGGYGWHWGCNESEREPRGAATLARCSCSAQAAHFLQETLWGFGKKTQCSVCRPAVYRTEPPCCIPCAAPPPPPLLPNARLPLLKIALQHTSRKEAARIALFSQLCSKKKTATLLAAPPPPRLLFSRPFSEAHVHANWTIWWI